MYMYVFVFVTVHDHNHFDSYMYVHVSPQIPEARSLLSRSLELLSSLRSIQHQLIMVPSGNSVLWDSTTEQVNSYKVHLCACTCMFKVYVYGLLRIELLRKTVSSFFLCV